jgi:hypothetical protein
MESAFAAASAKDGRRVGRSNVSGREMSIFNQIGSARAGSRKQRFLMAAALAAALFGAPGARAQDDQQSSVPLGESSCETDVKAMQDRRMKLINEFNEMAKAHGGKLDPVESCPKLKNLAVVEMSFKTYMVKNKDWCNIPDDAIANVTDSQSKTAALALKVCNVAEQFKKQQEMQASGGGGAAAPKLPAGPL